jgi:transcription initiation factor TFIIIB Brf1 subunit/transcription initiation factor TFIIB
MADIDFFDSVYHSLSSNPLNSLAPNYEKLSFDKECSHENITVGPCNKVCLDCGIEISDQILKTHFDTGRCNIRRSCEKSIYHDVKDMNISDKVVRVANDLFSQVTSNIRRGNIRKSIVFACIYQAYKLTGNPQSPEPLMQLFHITKGAGARGMKYISKYIPRDSKIRSMHTTPVDIIKNIVDRFRPTPEQEKSIIDIYKEVQHRSIVINRSRPLSVAAGVVFYWIEKNKSTIQIEDFVKEVNMSAMTIRKIVKEVRRLVDVFSTP